MTRAAWIGARQPAGHGAGQEDPGQEDDRGQAGGRGPVRRRARKRASWPGGCPGGGAAMPRSPHPMTAQPAAALHPEERAPRRGVRGHRTTTRLTHFVWRTPGRSGPIRRQRVAVVGGRAPRRRGGWPAGCRRSWAWTGFSVRDAVGAVLLERLDLTAAPAGAPAIGSRSRSRTPVQRRGEAPPLDAGDGQLGVVRGQGPQLVEGERERAWRPGPSTSSR